MSNDAVPAGLTAGTWNLDPEHSDINFSVRHAGISKVRGKFSAVSATATVGETLADSSVQAVIQANSFETGNEGRDEHVCGADFLDAEKYPELTFKSTSILSRGETYALNGELTIHGVSRDVTFEVEFNGVAVDPFGNTRAGFSGGTEISRKDFDLTWNAALETGGVLVGDKITITLDVQFTPAA